MLLLRSATWLSFHKLGIRTWYPTMYPGIRGWGGGGGGLEGDKMIIKQKKSNYSKKFHFQAAIANDWMQYIWTKFGPLKIKAANVFGGQEPPAPPPPPPPHYITVGITCRSCRNHTTIDHNNNAILSFMSETEVHDV